KGRIGHDGADGLFGDALTKPKGATACVRGLSLTDAMHYMALLCNSQFSESRSRDFPRSGNRPGVRRRVLMPHRLVQSRSRDFRCLASAFSWTQSNTYAD